MSIKNRPKLSDVASRVGITRMTVSRYFRDPNSVSATTRAKIEKVVSELGFVPSRLPDMLSNRGSKAIGVLIPSLSNQVFSDFCTGVESVTRKAGYQTLITHYGYSTEEESRQIASLLSYHVDGLILTESEHTEAAIKMIKAVGVPVVETMDIPVNPLDMVVGIDHYEAAYKLIFEMIQRGRKHIVYLGARLDRRTRLRLAGYQQAMLDHGLEPHTVLTKDHSNFTLGRHLMAETLRQCPLVDGVFCTNDDIAIGAMMYCQTHSIALPEKIAIAGYNALDIGKAITPQLATVDTQRHKVGAMAAQMLIDRLAGKELTEKEINLGYQLVLSSSLGE